MLPPQTQGGQVPGATSRCSSTAACRRTRPSSSIAPRHAHWPSCSTPAASARTSPFCKRRFTTRSVRRRLAQLARTHGAVASGGVRVDLPLTHELLGQAVGSARETVTSALRTLEQEGFLIREGRLYRLMISPEIFDLDEHGPAMLAEDEM